MNAGEVKAALRDRWPTSDYVVLEEAALDPSRQGRKADLVAISCWASRGFTVDAVEVKVSYGDWTRERDKAAKADLWWRHSDRFWLACPAKLADRVRPELPAGWGLLAVDGGKAKSVVTPPAREREDVSWAQTIALLRSAQAAGVGALQRAEQAGYRQGREAGMEEAKRQMPTVARDEHAAELAGFLDQFEKDTGLHLTTRYEVARLAAAFTQLGRMFGAGRVPAEVARDLEFHAAEVRRQATGLDGLAKNIAAAFPSAADATP